MTANRALRELSADGFLSRVPGVGTFVKEPPARSSLLELRNIAEEIAQRGHAGSMGDAATAVFLAAGAARGAYWAIRSNLGGGTTGSEGRSLPDSALSHLERVEANEWRVRQLLSERVP